MNLINRSESVLLAYAGKRLDQLTQELASYQTEEQKRLENSLKIQREEDAKLTELKLKQEADRMVSEFETTLKKKVSNSLLWSYYYQAFLSEDDKLMRLGEKYGLSLFFATLKLLVRSPVICL